jgi:hypothetical protein
MNSQKKIIKVRDNTFNHEPPFLQDTENIHFVRNCARGSNGDVPINSGDIVLYSDKWFTKIHPDSKVNIAMLIESPEIDPASYNYISENNKNFDMVLTYNKELLDRKENFILNVYGTTWMADPYIRIWKKSKMCSIITSPKLITTGHKLRHEVITNILQNNKDVDLYGGQYTPLSFSKTTPFDANHTPRHVTNGKIYGLKDYMFSIIIENQKKDYLFTEKLIDALLTGTVPIYYGCPSIGDFFNTDGMIIVDNVNDYMTALDTLSKDKYESMMPHIQDNFERAKKYKIYNFNESEVLKRLGM